jgi:hypothetical protein
VIRPISSALFVLVLLSGCATVSPANLYWGNYSNTLYQVKKNPGDETKKAHQIELQSIVEKSKEKNLRVPPGIYAELGMYAKELGDDSAAKQYFNLEQETYPESGPLMKRVQDFQ